MYVIYATRTMYAVHVPHVHCTFTMYNVHCVFYVYRVYARLVKRLIEETQAFGTCVRLRLVIV